MSDKLIFFLDDHLTTIMSIVAGLLISSGVTNKNSQITMVGCTLFIISMMYTIFA